jgi:hypothetical protein
MHDDPRNGEDMIGTPQTPVETSEDNVEIRNAPDGEPVAPDCDNCDECNVACNDGPPAWPAITELDPQFDPSTLPDDEDGSVALDNLADEGPETTPVPDVVEAPVDPESLDLVVNGCWEWFHGTHPIAATVIERKVKDVPGLLANAIREAGDRLNIDDVPGRNLTIREVIGALRVALTMLASAAFLGAVVFQETGD